MPTDILNTIPSALVPQQIFTVGTPAAAYNLVDANNNSSALTFDGLVAAAARQAVRADLGAVYAPEYGVRLVCGTASALSGSIGVYAAFAKAAAGTILGDGGTTGSDATYTGGSVALAEGLNSMQLAGSKSYILFDSAGGVSIVFMGIVRPTARYLDMVIANNTNATLLTDASHAIYLDPIWPQAQNAV